MLTRGSTAAKQVGVMYGVLTEYRRRCFIL